MDLPSDAGDPRSHESDDEEATLEARAGDLLDVRVEHRHSRFVSALMFIPSVITGLIRQVLPWAHPEVAHPCAVVIFRKSDGVEVLRYRYRFASEAYDHLAHTVGQLATRSAPSLCRDLGIDERELHA